MVRIDNISPSGLPPSKENQPTGSISKEFSLKEASDSSNLTISIKDYSPEAQKAINDLQEAMKQLDKLRQEGKHITKELVKTLRKILDVLKVESAKASKDPWTYAASTLEQATKSLKEAVDLQDSWYSRREEFPTLWEDAIQGNIWDAMATLLPTPPA